MSRVSQGHRASNAQPQGEPQVLGPRRVETGVAGRAEPELTLMDLARLIRQQMKHQQDNADDSIGGLQVERQTLRGDMREVQADLYYLDEEVMMNRKEQQKAPQQAQRAMEQMRSDMDGLAEHVKRQDAEGGKAKPTAGSGAHLAAGSPEWPAGLLAPGAYPFRAALVCVSQKSKGARPPDPLGRQTPQLATFVLPHARVGLHGWKCTCRPSADRGNRHRRESASHVQ